MLKGCYILEFSVERAQWQKKQNLMDARIRLWKARMARNGTLKQVPIMSRFVRRQAMRTPFKPCLSCFQVTVTKYPQVAPEVDFYCFPVIFFRASVPPQTAERGSDVCRSHPETSQWEATQKSAERASCKKQIVKYSFIIKIAHRTVLLQGTALVQYGIYGRTLVTIRPGPQIYMYPYSVCSPTS